MMKTNKTGNTENPYRNLRVEFHILQPFPVSCLNRDDNNAPKTAIVGGIQRARVSSQCWKRQVRQAMHDEFGVRTGTRTRLLAKLIEDACREEGANETQAKACGDKIEKIFIKKEASKDEEGKSDTLIFLAPSEVKRIAQKFKEFKFNPDKVIKQSDAKKQAKEFAGIIGEQKLKAAEDLDGLDIALFGRMVAQAAELDVEAAASFSHAISTHKVDNEVEFFTALDDYSKEKGSAHMGSLEFNSATYYRYISLDLGQLYQTLGGSEYIPQAIDVFIKALYIGIPAARQATQSAASFWEYAKVLVRRGQRLQIPFETAVRARDGGFLKPSIEELKNFISKKEANAGSLFGKIAEFDFGEDGESSIDDLIAGIQKAVQVK
ncbi:MAG: type I-E CRISPR-associated protein Cas7/Cse4/CasC [Treponema sp.]|jgi:CRISPR system Cascade subunit CasC|nr:type I-E CRISPR-associated protein Cas7/Cse4/CasC [Treponema sp.]